MDELPMRLRKAMEDADVDQPTLAKMVGCTQGAISQILLGNTLRSKFLPDIADALGVDLRWLRGSVNERGEGKPKSLKRPSSVLLTVQLPNERFLTRMFAGALQTAGKPELVDELAPLLAQLLPNGLARAQALQSGAVTEDENSLPGEAFPPPARSRRERPQQPHT